MSYVFLIKHCSHLHMGFGLSCKSRSSSLGRFLPLSLVFSWSSQLKKNWLIFSKRWLQKNHNLYYFSWLLRLAGSRLSTCAAVFSTRWVFRPSFVDLLSLAAPRCLHSLAHALLCSAFAFVLKSRLAYFVYIIGFSLFFFQLLSHL